MSLQCPLCGKQKPEEALFCENCTKKIRTDYEVDLPESGEKATIQIKEEEAAPGNFPVVEEKPAFRTSSMAQEVLPVSDLPQFAVEGELMQPEKSADDAGSGSKRVGVDEEIHQEFYSRKKKTAKPFLWLALTAILLVAAFFIYNETIRKSNLERSGWDKALKTNSVEGYLDYMTSHPSGVHFEEANAMLMRLKQNQAASWEQLKTTDNLTALRDFLQQYPESPYTSLVKRQIDSLSWIGALKLNNAAAYSEYILQAQSGDFGGEYLTLANNRYEMLFQSYPVNENQLDSIRMTVNGFYSALSKVDHDGLRKWLAPVVDRFFESGRAPRERIAGELLMAAAQTQHGILQFDADVNVLQYEKTMNDVYKVNIPLTKSFVRDGKTEEIPGYIVHMELDSLFHIFRIYETKPHPDAP